MANMKTAVQLYVLLLFTAVISLPYYQRHWRIPAPPVFSAPTFVYAARILNPQADAEAEASLANWCQSIPGATLATNGVCMLPPGEIFMFGR